MQKSKKTHSVEKNALHPRNRHRQRYDFSILTKTCPELSPFVRLNEFDNQTIDFANPEAVLALNRALLKQYYKINYWNIPPGYLCPPIPGRADYIHYLADLLAASNNGTAPTGDKIKCLDIGVGANCIYPIIGSSEYGWHFVGSDVENTALKSAAIILEKNATLKSKVVLRLQKNDKNILRGIIQKDEKFDVSLCNPPFHSSQTASQEGTLRKLSNLNKKKITKVNLNFGGKSKELWCNGGEEAFIKKMIEESQLFSDSCLWFTTLVAKSEHLKYIYTALNDTKVSEFKTIPMAQGNKTSRFVAWTYLNDEQRREWASKRWQH